MLGVTLLPGTRRKPAKGTPCRREHPAVAVMFHIIAGSW